MNSIMIEKVSNGWIVREPYYRADEIAANTTIFVYKTIEEIKNDLENLLKIDTKPEQTYK